MCCWGEGLVIVVLSGDLILAVLALKKAVVEAMALKQKNAIAGIVAASQIIVFAGVAVLAALSLRIFVHLIVLLPFLTRAALAAIFHDAMKLGLTDEQKQRGDYRAISLGLMPISFAGLIALTVIEAKVAKAETIQFFPLYYMLLSFLGFYVVLTIQSYKDKVWHAQLGSAFLDASMLSLLLSVVSLFLSSDQSEFYKVFFTMVALGVWLLDHLIRIGNEAWVLRDS